VSKSDAKLHRCIGGEHAQATKEAIFENASGSAGEKDGNGMLVSEKVRQFLSEGSFSEEIFPKNGITRRNKSFRFVSIERIVWR
jgi:hypothetical protein